MINSKTLNIHKTGEVLYLTVPKLEASGAAIHAFSTRLGGVSGGDCAKMNFSFSLDKSKADVLENFKIFTSAFGGDFNKIVLSKQTHTKNVKIVTEDDIGKGVTKELDYTDVDGLITNIKGAVLVTQYADCTPLAFLDPKKRVVATSHAGWRGTVADIGGETVKLMAERFGSNPKDIICGIGPNIGKCCYEVDDPVISEINKLSLIDKSACFTDKGNGKYMLDLRETNRQLLVNAGILPENIDVADLCTCCHSDIFHSHRASLGKRGTLALMIALK